MQLTAVLPARRAANRQVDLPEMLTNCLLAANHYREFKRLVGWKGMAVCPRAPRAWTLRIRSRAGVFGLAAEDARRDGQGQHATLGLYYFPAPEEPLLETMSLAASFASTQPDYLETVRRFTAMGEWAAPFRMGTLEVSLAPEEDGLTLLCRALDRKLSIARDGVATPDGKWVIWPGEAEENFPAHEIARDFFLVLAASVTRSLEEPPCRAGQSKTPGHGLFYDCAGNRSPLDDGISLVTDLLCWGDRETLAALASLSLARCDVTAGMENRHTLPAPLDDALFWKTHDLRELSRDEAYAPAFDSRPGLIVLSGFLGAGKTTFLNQLLEYYAARDELVAIIQNEIGQTGVDGKLLEGDESIVELDEGCVCCTLVGNLSKGIEQLKARFNPKVIVLESTGLANPFNILNELETLRPLVRLDSITTLVDAENAPGLLSDHEIARDQVAAADTILLNKCDLVDEAERERLRSTLRELNNRAVLVETEHGAVNPGYLYDADPFEQRAGLLPCMPNGTRHTHADEDFTTHRLAFPSALDRDRLMEALDRLPDAVFRLKGIVHLSNEPQPAVVQYVCGRHELSPLGDDFDQDGFLVAIGRDMDLAVLEEMLGADA
ncbi:GTP-binding protein [Pseudodesulfovibrio thermohalotolerans]|uniref:CobW family GTP-binding protein n=1 Tax=Pseudodesulfovibrio thermohalotolerans TaxID=2880651 RepID=UPI0022B9E38E|nr:GTP-binding protein [Pseudodesulfovibrio thermohalotolerans]WFS63080.1 GTP-binding protein [Pseudodesulfovibrio thermohalotolerans]